MKPVKSGCGEPLPQPLPVSVMGVFSDLDAHGFKHPVMVAIGKSSFKPLLNFFNNSKANINEGLTPLIAIITLTLLCPVVESLSVVTGTNFFLRRMKWRV